ncbi:MAG: hypothetical protein COB77_04585 [Gammaproteobacteria bacterium]|nr:MAG: hypothetical protein COB77_04585 [Gammaproteobacteria bacterium]
METDSVGLTAIVGIIGAILTVLIKLFDVLGSWKKSRENDRIVKKEIDYTIREVEFINGWLTAVNNSSSDKERELRRNIALGHLDNLMSNYQNYCAPKKVGVTSTESKKSNKWFYALSVFLVMSILGMFVDDEDNWSITYFQNSFDQDTIIGLGFFLMVWVYFLLNSSFISKYRNKD